MESFARLHNPFVRFGLLIVVLTCAGLVLAATCSWAAWDNGDWATVFTPANKTPELRTAPDGFGGTLAIMCDSGDPIFPVMLTRIDHTGNEVWGDGGRPVPYEMTSDGTAGPVDVVADGAGGAYCVFSRVFGASVNLYLGHWDAQGDFDWNVPVGDYGPNPASVARLLPADNGDVLIVWTRSVGTVDYELIVTRRDSGGGPVWETTAWEDSNHDLDILDWVADTDQLGGVVLGIDYQAFSGLYEGRVQRVDTNGTLLWGARGHQAFGSLGSIAAVLPDAAGGAYLFNSLGWGNTWAQHVSAAGAETWVSGGLQPIPLNTYPDPTVPAFCVDGNGGFYLAEGAEDLFAQHVDVYGSRLWGANGLQVTSLAGWQDAPTLAHDGFGGAVLAYEDHYYSEFSDNHPRAVSAMRLDAFGNTLWENSAFWWNLSAGLTDQFVAQPRILADGSGGAQVVWNLYNDAFTTGQIAAAGLGPDGANPALPRLAYINPDAGAIGDVQTAFVLGDYLEASQTFTLSRSGGPEITLTGVMAASSQLVSGTLDLGSAQAGPYDLQLSSGGTVLATLPNAYGVGQMVPCDIDEPLAASSGQVQGFGSQRRVAFDSLGEVHTTWLEYGGGEYRLMWNVATPGGGDMTRTVVQTTHILRELSFAIDQFDVAQFVYVEENVGNDYLNYHRESLTTVPVTYTMPIASGVQSPALAVDISGRAHIVYEGADGGMPALFYTNAFMSGFSPALNLNAGANATNPDLTMGVGNGMTLTYVRDFWFPGLREVCYQQFDGAAWSAPAGMYFGVYVKSPSVAFDGADRLLFSWVLDNTGSAPLLHTMLMTNQVAGPVRWRTGLPSVYSCSVAASGPAAFQLLTMESDGNLPTRIFLREGDGEVFYPRRQLNSSADVDFPCFGVRYGFPGVAAVWAEYNDPATPMYRFQCFESGPVSAVEVPVVASGLAAYPNPFNPRTTFSFSQPKAGWTRLSIYNVAGERVHTLVDGFAETGMHRVAWDGRDGEGRILPSGVYFSRLQLPGGTRDLVKKITMLK